MGYHDKADRVVHAVIESADGAPPVEIVRYNVQGRWYWEQDQVSHSARGLMSLAEAVEMAADAEADPDSKLTWYQYSGGGTVFDARLGRALRKIADGQ